MKLGFRTKLSYGIGGAADNSIYTLIATYQLFFLTTVAGVKPALAGAIAAAGSIWECIMGPIVGYISDNIETRLGKRRPFLFIASVPAIFVLTLAFTGIDGSQGLKFAYYMLFGILIWQTFATFFVPYITLGSDLTDDYDERTKLRSFAYIGNQFGMIIGMVLPSLLVAKLMESGMSERGSWSAVGLSIGAVVVVSLLYCASTIKVQGPSSHPPVRSQLRNLLSAKKIAEMFKGYLSILRLRPAKFIIASSIIYLIANTFFSSSIIYSMTYRAELPAELQSLCLLIIAISGMLFSPMISRLAVKWDKTLIFKLGIALSGIIMIGAAFLELHSFAGLALLSFFYSFGNSCYWQLMPSMLYDICEAEELYSGSKHSAQVISSQALAESMATALGAQLLGILLQLAGFNESLPHQSPLTLVWIGNSTTIIPGILFVGIGLIMLKHPINKRTYARIIEALNRRAQGEEIDLNEFNDIYK